MVKKDNNNLNVIDFFCGAWGFSEGFRQQWFNIVQWIDYWKPAIDTHNLNHWLDDNIKSVLDFWSEDSENIDEINNLDDTIGIIWSPPCVSFSSSNKSWKADKTDWINLIKSFLRVIAVKKHQNKSKLKFWYMENVPNSQKHVEVLYTFEMLNLEKWAIQNGYEPSKPALYVQNNWDILNSGDYWAPQSRKRFISWEWCETGKFLTPKITHKDHINLWDILNKLPSESYSKKEIANTTYTDPNYPNLVVEWCKITDHFYDTGLYYMEWEQAEYFKKSHPFMWKMSFPENKEKPCRTIMATRSAKTRESIILKSHYNRKLDWEYRLPTIREIACFMWYPITYQFTWSEWSKWRQIWNAVSPHLSAALAKSIRVKLGLRKINKINFSCFENLHENITNLNTFEEAKLDKPKTRKKNAKFRRHPLKLGNITVELMNYLENKDWIPGDDWYIQMYFWTWVGFKQLVIDKNIYWDIVNYLDEKITEFSNFKLNFKKTSTDIWDICKSNLQILYENDLHLKDNKNPINFIKEIGKIIEQTKDKGTLVKGIDIIPKDEVPLGQLYAIYCIGNIIY